MPLVFDLDTALWFNERFVTTEVAPDEDLETCVPSPTTCVCVVCVCLGVCVCML